MKINYKRIIGKVDDMLLNNEIMTQEEREWVMEALYDTMDKTLNPPKPPEVKQNEWTGGYLGKKIK